MEALLEHLAGTENDFQVLGSWTELTISILLATIFGYVLMRVYSLYFQDNEPQDGSLARSLVLLAPAFTSTFWMIQNSLILSLGLMGTLSFVRFRTPIKRSEDIAFIIVTIAIAISCATGKFVVSLILCTFMFVYSFLRHRFSIGSPASKFAVVTINTNKTDSVGNIQGILGEHKVKGEFVSSRTYDGITSFVFNILNAGDQEHDRVVSGVKDYDKEAQISFFYPNERLG